MTDHAIAVGHMLATIFATAALAGLFVRTAARAATGPQGLERVILQAALLIAMAIIWAAMKP